MNKKKRIHWLYAIPLVLGVGIVILLALRWHAWFGNVDEEAYQTPKRITRLTLTPGEDFLHQRTLSWRYGEEEGLNPTFEFAQRIDSISEDSLHWSSIKVFATSIKTRSGVGSYYSVHLDSLKPGERYLYRISHSASISSGSFDMPIGLDTLTRFIYLGDIQDPSGAMSKELLSRFTPSQVSSEGINFFALAGDQIEGPSDKYWDIWYDSWQKKLLSSTPLILSTGNHEYLKRGFFRELDPRWVPQYNYPQNGPEGFEGRSYYIDFPLMRFIVLDSNGMNTLVDIWHHRSWLIQTLSSSHQPWQIVMFHHGVYSVRDGRSNPAMRHIFKPILEDYGADLVLQGHDHAYSRIASRGDNNELETPVYLISSTSPKVYRNSFDEIHDRLGSGLQLYQTIEVRPEYIDYRSELFTGELYDHIVIRKEDSKTNVVDDLAKDIPERFEFNAFGNNKKGQKKEKKYREEVRKRLSK